MSAKNTFVVNCITLTPGQSVILHQANRSRPAKFVTVEQGAIMVEREDGQLVAAEDLMQGTLAPFCFA